MRYDKSRWSSPRTARFSVPLGPFERANRSARKKRNEFRSTAPRPRVLGKSQSWLMAAHQLASAYQILDIQSFSGMCSHPCRVRKTGVSFVPHADAVVREIPDNNFILIRDLGSP